MSDRIITGIRLLRAVFMAQRALDGMDGKTGRWADAEWSRLDKALFEAKAALDAFEAGTETDYKLKQAGE